MKHSILIIGLIISFNLFGQDLTRKEKKYIPKDFNESLTQLDKVIPDSTKNRIKSMTENDFIAQTHFSTGMWIRSYVCNAQKSTSQGGMIKFEVQQQKTSKTYANTKIVN